MSWLSSMLSPNEHKKKPAAQQAPATGHDSGGHSRPDGKVSYGFSALRGKRATMEDFCHAQFAKTPAECSPLGFFGVFDGHGGSGAADFVNSRLFATLLSKLTNTSDVRAAIVDSFVETDNQYLAHSDSQNRDEGCTAVAAVLIGQRLLVANVGDSRAVLARGEKAIPMSEDHKPNRVDERERIEAAGGVVVWAGTWRVGGVLAVSRAFGDRLLKQYIVAEPDLMEEVLTSADDALIMASDGLWDVMDNQAAVTLIKDIKDPEKAARRLTEEAYARGSNDNITCVVVRFHF